MSNIVDMITQQIITCVGCVLLHRSMGVSDIFKYVCYVDNSVMLLGHAPDKSELLQSRIQSHSSKVFQWLSFVMTITLPNGNGNIYININNEQKIQTHLLDFGVRCVSDFIDGVRSTFIDSLPDQDALANILQIVSCDDNVCQ